MENLNSREYLEKIKIQVLSNLERTRHTPSVQMTDVGKSITEHQEQQDDILDDLDEDTVGMDRRSTQRQWEKRVEREGELEDDSEDEEMADALGVRSQGVKRRRNEANFGEEGMGRGEDMEPENIASGGEQGGASVFTPTGGAGSENDVEKVEDPSKALGYNGEHDEELEALAKETELEDQQPQAQDGDGDVEMEEAALEKEHQAEEEADKMDAEPTPVEATATTPAPEAAVAATTPAPTTLDAPDAPAPATAATPVAPSAEGEKEPEKSS